MSGDEHDVGDTCCNNGVGMILTRITRSTGQCVGLEKKSTHFMEI
jgi:hypothetical protein